MKLILRISVFIMSALLIMVGIAVAKTYAQNADPNVLINSLKGGGYVVVLRHGATDHSQSDVQPPDYTDVTKQRRLSNAGRDTARQIGNSLKETGIVFGQVKTSLLDRGIETGKIVSGIEVTPVLDLTESGDSVDQPEKDRRSQVLRDLVGVSPEPGKNTLLVTHKPNIVFAFGDKLA
ncbi:MAG: histidine phosphatase family protein, partial [Candidatus Omnitrophica bacterium]|nr:histidine phosphatase family protein [Candidatus Omnitrophota bacterium]